MEGYYPVLLCLPPTEGWRGKQILSPLSGYPYQQPIDRLRVEPAGRYFEEFLARKLNFTLSWTAPAVEREPEVLTEEEEASQSSREHKKKQHAPLTTEDDPYVIMGLADRRWMATDDEIKKAYRKAVLAHHPDKKMSGDAVEDADDAMFKSITKAYDILSNPRKRRAYDSQEPFDDSIPSSFDTTSDFYKTYGPVFARNAKWSTRQPIPSLGDDSTDYDDVVDFYDFWFSFSSWRDFSYEDEYDPEEAESREEKRWMERQNERQRARLKKEEQVRLNTLVSNAHKRDPRIKRHLEELKEQKRKKKEEKYAEQKRLKEEQERQEALEREKKEQEEKARQAEAKKKTKALRTARANLRRLCRDHNVTVQTTDLDTLCTKLDLQRLKALCQTIQGNPASALEAINAELTALKEASAPKTQPPKQEETQPEKLEGKGNPWTEEELALLAQATAKFPGGTGARWKLIGQFINDKTGGNRTVKEIVAITQELKKKADHAVPPSADAYDRFKSHKKGDNISGPIDNISQRWDSPVSVVDTPATTTLTTTTPTTTSTPTTTPSKSPTPAAAKPSAKPGAAKTAPAKGSPAAVPAKPQPPATPSPSTPSTTTTPQPAAASAAIAEWSQEQQKALEAAMKTYPATLGAKRWDSIAAAVPGKSKKECVDRYKYLVELYKKPAATAK